MARAADQDQDFAKVGDGDDPIDAIGQSLAMLRREVRETTDVRDGLNELRERRIAAIEEALAAPWPRRWLLAWGFRRRLRRSSRECAWAGCSWYERRAQGMSEELYKMRG